MKIKVLTIALGVGILSFFGAPAYADIIDLTVAGGSNGAGSAGAIGGNFIVQQINPSSTGTGVIDSFVRIQHNGSERGYNTSLAAPPVLDDKAGNFTRALTLGEVPIVHIGSFDYRQFLLDINESSQLVDLNQIQIFARNGDTVHSGLTEATAGHPAVIQFSNATEVFRMNNNTCSGGDYPADNCHDIRMDYQLNSGSGSGDMFLYVLSSLFTLGNSSNVILFSQFGTPPGANDSDDGFEEWSVLKSSTQPCIGCEPPPLPEPSSLLLFGTAGLGILVSLRRRFGKQS